MIHPEETMTKKPENDDEKASRALDVDEYLEVIGQFNRFQILLLLLFCFVIIPSTYQTLVMSFVGHNPSWRCATQPNATVFAAAVNASRVTGTKKECLVLGDVDGQHEKYEERCDMDRSLWRYTEERDYSIVTEVSQISLEVII